MPLQLFPHTVSPFDPGLEGGHWISPPKADLAALDHIRAGEKLLNLQKDRTFAEKLPFRSGNLQNRLLINKLPLAIYS